MQDRCLPEYYRWQVQHQLRVTRADIADVYNFDWTEGITFPVAPDESNWPQIRAAWDEFAKYVAEKHPPPLTERDTRTRDATEWLSAAAMYLELRTAYEELSTKYDEAKARLIGLTQHAKEEGSGVAVTRFWKRGSIDYKRVPELRAVDLGSYRSGGRRPQRCEQLRM